MKLSKTLVSALLVSSVLGVSGGGFAAKTKINVWHPWGGQDGKAFQEFVDQFNKEHKDIEVKTQTVAAPDIDKKVLLAIAAGTGPDVAWGFPALLGRNHSFIVPLNRYLDRDKETAQDVYDEYWKAGYVKGKPLGVPIEANGEAVLLNKTLFSNSGLPLPKNDWKWTDLVDIGRKLTIDKNGDGKPDQWGWSQPYYAPDPWPWLTYLWQAGGDVLDDSYQPKKSIINSPEGIEALQFNMDLGSKYKISTPELTVGGFNTNKVAMEANGAWVVTDYKKSKGLQFDGVTLPSYKKKANILLIAHLYIVKSKAKREDAAWEFVRWFTNGKNNASWALKTGYLPVRKSSMKSAEYTSYAKTTPAIGAFIDGLDSARPRPFWLPTWSKMADSIVKQIGLALNQKSSAAQALGTAQQEINKIIAITK